MVTAKLYHGKEIRLSEVHDGFVRWVLPFEFVVGQAAIIIFKYWHKRVGFSICGLVFAFHNWVPYKFYKAAKLTEDHADLFFSGLYLAMPCLFRAVDLGGDSCTDGPKDEAVLCPWLFPVSTGQSLETLTGTVTSSRMVERYRSGAVKDIRGGGEEQATAAAQGDHHHDAADAGDDVGDTGGDDVGDVDAGM